MKYVRADTLKYFMMVAGNNKIIIDGMQEPFDLSVSNLVYSKSFGQTTPPVQRSNDQHQGPFQPRCRRPTLHRQSNGEKLLNTRAIPAEVCGTDNAPPIQR